MRSTRMRRTDDLVRRVLSEAILLKLQDPRIGFVSVTGVRISKEFDTAKVFVTIMGDEEAKRETLKGLKSAGPFLQSCLASELRLRRIPKLRFIYDDQVDRGMRVDAALRELDIPDKPEEEADEAEDR